HQRRQRRRHRQRLFGPSLRAGARHHKPVHWGRDYFPRPDDRNRLRAMANAFARLPSGTKKVTGRILVPLRRCDRMEDVISYLEQIARPGCKVILLIHYSVQGLDWFQEKSVPSVGREQKLATKNNTLLALEPLRQRDVTVALDIYAGSLRK